MINLESQMVQSMINLFLYGGGKPGSETRDRFLKLLTIFGCSCDPQLFSKILLTLEPWECAVEEIVVHDRKY